MTDLLENIEAYLNGTGMAPATFGRDVMGDPNFVFDLRSGRDYRSSTVRKIEDFIAAHPPVNKENAT